MPSGANKKLKRDKFAVQKIFRTSTQNSKAVLSLLKRGAVARVAALCQHEDPAGKADDGSLIRSTSKLMAV